MLCRKTYDHITQNFAEPAVHLILVDHLRDHLGPRASSMSIKIDFEDPAKRVSDWHNRREQRQAR